MVQQKISESETLQNKSQSFASNGKDEMDILTDEIKSHLQNISDYMEHSKTRYAFHEADTASVKLQQLCDMEEKLTNEQIHPSLPEQHAMSCNCGVCN